MSIINSKFLRLAIVLAAAEAVLLGAPAGTRASIVKGPFTFANSAFADAANMVNGSVTFHGASNLEEAVTGDFLGSFVQNFYAGEIFEVGFTDNYVYNGSGDDLVIFEEGLPNNLRVAVYANGHSAPTAYRSYTPVALGILDGVPTTAAVVDLSDFGLPADAPVSWVLIQSDDVNNVEISGIGALNSVPEPATAALLGFAALALLRRRGT
jgi:hypothetical protein